jgi:hypothetical protein
MFDLRAPAAGGKNFDFVSKAAVAPPMRHDERYDGWCIRNARIAMGVNHQTIMTASSCRIDAALRPTGADTQPMQAEDQNAQDQTPKTKRKKTKRPR